MSLDEKHIGFKEIEEICEKSTWHGSFSKLAAVIVTISQEQKIVFRYALDKYVNHIAGLCAF